MRALLVTVAGMSTRFSESIGQECLKCVYYKNSIEDSLLYQLLNQPVDFDRYIIVGGYKFEELSQAIDTYFGKWKDKISLIQNEHYRDYGSGYSLLCGLKEAIRLSCDEVVFAEGDLFLDASSFVAVSTSSHNVITSNPEDIYANKAVAFYIDCKDQIHYLYDTKHQSLFVPEPFKAIFNSGQVWKFSQKELIESTMRAISKEEWQGTNLVFVERYFHNADSDDLEVVAFKKWINCNTIADYNQI